VHVAGWKFTRYTHERHVNFCRYDAAIDRTSAAAFAGQCRTWFFISKKGERNNLMDLQTVLIWIVIGAIAGVLAESMVGGPRRGGLGTAILIGILGAFIGGWLFSALGISLGAGILGTIITAFIGAIILLLIVRGVSRRR
jgi:uncharacterized membrane protein YeaQ/YmgE (transglycosylase-associated protein family)